MDLGFGSRNQEVGSATARALLEGAKAQEQAIDADLRKFDRLLDDEDGLEALRQRRIEQMKKRHGQLKRWKDLGHGAYEELGGGGTNDSRDVARDFFAASKESERLVVHFYRPSTRYCDVFHAHLSKIAPKHPETRFVKVSVEDCDHQGGGASFLVERLGVVMMPTLVLVKDRRAFHHVRGFDELGGTADFSETALAYLLGRHGVIDPRDDEELPDGISGFAAGVNSIHVRKGARSGFYGNGAEEEIEGY